MIEAAVDRMPEKTGMSREVVYTVSGPPGSGW